MRVYFDNAATTPLDPEVFEAMKPLLLENFGNPSSIHAHGRQVKSQIEKARKTVAGLLNTSPAEIFFTSGGTEADNTALINSVEAYGLRHAITSRLEHHAVLHTLKFLEKSGKVALSFVDLDARGRVDLTHLEMLLRTHPRSLVSLMHGNNEVGNLLDIDHVAELCATHDAIFHSDTVQTMGHYRHDLQRLRANFIVGAAHKFHGPKGVGFLYVRADTRIQPFIHGGAQERNQRGGTENVYGIVGLARALELAYAGMDQHRRHIEGLKARMIERLRDAVPDVTFNGDSADLDRSLYTVLNVLFPPSGDADMLLFNLDIARISASGGSACSSGSAIGSHVLAALGVADDQAAVRFSFSKYNTPDEVDYVAEKLGEILAVRV